MQKVKLTKRQLRKLFREIISSAQKMSNLPYHKKNEDSRIFIEDDALEYIMLINTDRQFGAKPNYTKYYNKLFRKGKQPLKF